MKLDFVTSVNKLYFDEYGKRLVASSFKHLPASVSFRMYCEASQEGLDLDAYSVSGANCAIERIDLFETTTLGQYLTNARPLVEDKMGCKVSNNPAERRAERGYNYVWDALTFGKKGFSLSHALRTTCADYLFWVDADIVFFRPMTENILKRLFRHNSDVVYFGRKDFHTETGFVGFKMKSPCCREFGERYGAQWEQMKIFENQKGWTDCHAFDTVLTEMTAEGKIKGCNLSWTPNGHVMAHSPLAMYFDHQKGDRKRAGGSPERERYGLRRITEPLRFCLWRLGLIG